MSELDRLFSYYAHLIDYMLSHAEPWDTDEESIIWARDDIAELTKETTKEIIELDIRFLKSREKVKQLVSLIQWNATRGILAFPDAWWANLDRLCEGSYPFDKLPNYLKDVAKQYYK